METIEIRGNVYRAACPTRQILDLIGDKWTALIIGLLEERTMRFSELSRDIDGISQKMLTQTLRKLERDGIVTRTVYPEVPPRVEYSLTRLGETLTAPLSVFREWAETHIEAVTQAQIEYDNRQE
ncbi:MAG: helix-turn-helix transcriptional regulator [Anaerolineae bacterium]|nr:helix-turn-helix transcriptional regulator [Anaerolineae bacterium]